MVVGDSVSNRLFRRMEHENEHPSDKRRLNEDRSVNAHLRDFATARQVTGARLVDYRERTVDVRLSAALRAHLIQPRFDCGKRDALSFPSSVAFSSHAYSRGVMTDPDAVSTPARVKMLEHDAKELVSSWVAEFWQLVESPLVSPPSCAAAVDASASRVSLLNSMVDGKSDETSEKKRRSRIEIAQLNGQANRAVPRLRRDRCMMNSK